MCRSTNAIAFKSHARLHVCFRDTYIYSTTFSKFRKRSYSWPLGNRRWRHIGVGFYGSPVLRSNVTHAADATNVLMLLEFLCTWGYARNDVETDVGISVNYRPIRHPFGYQTGAMTLRTFLLAIRVPTQSIYLRTLSISDYHTLRTSDTCEVPVPLAAVKLFSFYCDHLTPFSHMFFSSCALRPSPLPLRISL